MHLYIEPLNGSIDVTSFFRRMKYTTQKIAFFFDLWCPLSYKLVLLALHNEHLWTILFRSFFVVDPGLITY